MIKNTTTKDRLAALKKRVTKPVKKAKSAKKKAPAKSKVVVVKPEFAYTLKDAVVGDLVVLHSANAWWLDRGKVERLVEAYKWDATHEEASVNAGITIHQLKYFIELHPEFSTIISACREMPNLTARKSVLAQMEKDGNLAFKYLSVKKAGEFGPKPPVVAVQINMADRVAAKRDQYE